MKKVDVCRVLRTLAVVALLGVVFASCDEADYVVVEPEPEGDEWLDPAFGAELVSLGLIEDASTATPSDVSGVTTLDLRRKPLTSLRGIEMFRNLDTLNVSQCNLSGLDVEGLKNLKWLDCSYNRTMSVLNLKGCGELRYLELCNCSVEALDVSDCSLLKELDCGNNEIEVLDVAALAEVENLYCYGNWIAVLDLNGCTKLKQLISYDNMLEGLDISNCRELTLLYTLFNPGKDGKFVVKAWFDNDNVPEGFTTMGWEDEDGGEIVVEYQKVV